MYRVHPFSQPMNQQWGDKLRRTTVKMSSTFRVFAFFMAVLIFSMPVINFAQQNPIETKAQIEAEARAQAIADAENDAHKKTWFMAGCFLNLIGVVIANKSKAPVPAERLVGKSPAYVAAYTSSYQARLTQVRNQYAQWGCALGTLGYLSAFNAIRNDPGCLLLSLLIGL